MPRLKPKRYQQPMMGAMVAYIAAMVLVWSPVCSTASVPLKWMIALAPLLPMLYVIGLMARRIRNSDELKPRTHPIGWGVASGAVGVLSRPVVSWRQHKSRHWMAVFWRGCSL